MSVRFFRPIVVATSVLVALLVAWSVFGLPASARSNVGAPVQQATSGHTIGVGGHGEVSVAPDMATISVGVQSKGDTAAGTLASAATKLTAVIAAIKAQGVPDKNIQTVDLNLYYDSQNGVYVVDHSLSVKLDGTDKVGAVLDAAVQAGANNSWGVEFGLKDPSAGRSQALQAAIKDARTRADSIATALGVTISGVGDASETSYSPPPPIRYGTAQGAAPSASAPTPVQPGQLTVSADVSVTYTFG